MLTFLAVSRDDGPIAKEMPSPRGTRVGADRRSDIEQRTGIVLFPSRSAPCDAPRPGSVWRLL